LPVLIGRLKAKLDYWHTIGANSFVTDIIKCGYRIPFISTPCKAHFSNNKSAWDNASFVESAISELVSNHAVVEVPFVPHVVNPLSVSIQSSGKKRLILDLRYVNQFIWKNKFKREDLRVLLSYVNKGDYLSSFDLKSGYHHFDIFPDHKTFWGFSWSSLVLSDIFVFQFYHLVLVRPHTFLRSASDRLFNFGVLMVLKIAVFLDDGCGKGDSLQIAKRHSLFVQSCLSTAGFVANSMRGS